MPDDTINDLPPGRPLPPSMDTPSDTARHIRVLGEMLQHQQIRQLFPEHGYVVFTGPEQDALRAAIAALQAVERVRAWQQYAARLEVRRDDVVSWSGRVLACLQRLANSRWWQWRERRAAREDVADARLGAAACLSRYEPTRPADEPRLVALKGGER